MYDKQHDVSDTDRLKLPAFHGSPDQHGNLSQMNLKFRKGVKLVLYAVVYQTFQIQTHFICLSLLNLKFRLKNRIN